MLGCPGLARPHEPCCGLERQEALCRAPPACPSDAHPCYFWSSPKNFQADNLLIASSSDSSSLVFAGDLAYVWGTSS